jgi:hypothetical protein
MSDELRFTWWPWKMLTIAIPLFAIGAALLGLRERHHDVEPNFIFFTILAAGNGFLLGSAIGDLRRTLIAVFMGAIVAATSLQLFALTGSRMIIFGLMCLAAMVFILVARNKNFFLSLVQCIALIYIWIAGIEMWVEEPFALVLAFVFMWCCIAAIFPIDDAWSSRATAVWAGLLCSVRGVIFGVAAQVVLMALLPVRPIPKGYWDNYFGVPVDALVHNIVVVTVANFFTARALFCAATRTAPPTARETVRPVALEGE